VTLTPLPAEPPVDSGLVDALRRAYDEAVAEPEMPVSGRDLVLAMLAERRDVFAQPQATLTTLCEAAGLEKRASEVAHDTAIWANARRLARMGRISYQTDGDDELAEIVVEVLDVCDDLAAESGDDGPGDGTGHRDTGDQVRVDDADVRHALDHLADLDVLALASDELLDPLYVEPSAEHMVGRLIAAADTGTRRAVARLLASLHAEATGDWLAAEQHLELAVESDPEFEPSTDRLAWYASDRGDAARAARLWRRCPPSAAIRQDLAALEPFIRPAASVGRNDPCWCGSGRKYKQCHLDTPAPALLADRVGWLCRKAVAYLERAGPEAREAVMEVVAGRVDDADDEVGRALNDPLVMDLTLAEGGWFARFLADRGHLLPDDEALLAASWVTVDRSVFEVTAVTPGAGLCLRDLRTGDAIDVRERTFSQAARTGTLVCARVVPDGTTHQIIGGIFPVAPGTEADMLDVLDTGDPYEIADWVRDLERPPELRTREGEPVVQCEVVVTADDSAAFVRHLDAVYDVEAPGELWTESHALDEAESVLRASLRLDGDRLTVTTNSDRRADRILDRFPAELGVRVVSDTRTPLDAGSLRRGDGTGLPDLRGVAGTGRGPELGDADIAHLQEQMEERWCAEPVPALGGVTPREAAADPTRREQLERLLASFDAMVTPSGAFTLRTDRLRARLGLH
jgi:SEC-C motif